MRFVATDVFDYHRPSKCGLRVYLRAQGAAEAPPSPFEETLRRLGRSHEARDLAALAATTDVVDLSRVDDRRERERETLRLLSEGAQAIYQGRLRALVEVELDGEACEIVGEPDFLIRTAAGHRIRDSKLARRIEGPRHPEIRLQLQLYGFLYERLMGRPPAALEVHSGSGDLVSVPYDGGGAALGYLRFLRSLRAASTEPYEPVGWSKCGGCGFQERCWTRAQESRDVALLPTMSQGLARELASRGTRTLGELLSRFDENSLAAIEYRDGRGRRSVGGGSAREILRSARVLSTGKEEIFAPPELRDPGFARPATGLRVSAGVCRWRQY
jgi:predicted RecB family nuclease